MPSGPLYYLFIFLAATAVIGVKFGPQIVKILKPKPNNKAAAPSGSVFLSSPPTPTATGFTLKELLSPTEKKLFKSLEQALNPDNQRVFAKVKLDSMFAPANNLPEPVLSLLAVDFLVIDTEIMEPAFAIMVEESAFNEAAANEVEAVKLVCSAGQLPVITIPAQVAHDVSAVKERISQGSVR